MNTQHVKCLLPGVLALALLAGCGGGDNADTSATSPTSPTSPTEEVAQTVSAVVDYISNMISNYSENSDPVGVNAITLAVDDTSEPTSLK